MRIIVSGGGTGGHIYPAVTIINAIKELKPAAEFLYVGTEKGLEADIIPKEGLPFAGVNIEGFERHITAQNFIRAAKAMVSVVKARQIVKNFRPDIAIGTGGYAAGPVLLAASLMNVPTLIQEQNVVAGITNKILAKFVTKIAVGCQEATAKFPAEKTIFTGNPVRKEILSAKREDGIKAFGFNPQKKIVLVSGGSRGARSINRAMVDVIKNFAEGSDLQILLVTGKAEYEDIIKRIADAGVNLENNPHIKVEPYLYNMPQALAMADLAVFRAGATSIAELTARGVPAVLIPYPYAAENHQEFNARALAEAGAAQMILNKDLTGELLAAAITKIMADEEVLANMAKNSRAMGKPAATEDIAKLAIGLAAQKERCE